MDYLTYYKAYEQDRINEARQARLTRLALSARHAVRRIPRLLRAR